MMTADQIQHCLEQHMPQAIIKVKGDDGVHFEAMIVNSDFNGKSRLARHRMVYQALGDKMQADIHALALQTLTPEEATAKQ